MNVIFIHINNIVIILFIFTMYFWNIWFWILKFVQDLQFQTNTHFTNELPIDLSIANKSSTNNSDSRGEYYKLEYEENNNNSIIYPRTVQQYCRTCGDENIAPNVNGKKRILLLFIV